MCIKKERMIKKNKKRGNPNWCGSRLNSKLIKKYADQWCRDNGYPIKKTYVQNLKGGHYE